MAENAPHVKRRKISNKSPVAKTLPVTTAKELVDLLTFEQDANQIKQRKIKFILAKIKD